MPPSQEPLQSLTSFNSWLTCKNQEVTGLPCWPFSTLTRFLRVSGFSPYQKSQSSLHCESWFLSWWPRLGCLIWFPAHHSHNTFKLSVLALTCRVEGVGHQTPPGDPPPHCQQPGLQAPGEGEEDGIVQGVGGGASVVLITENYPLDATHVSLQAISQIISEEDKLGTSHIDIFSLSIT